MTTTEFNDADVVAASLAGNRDAFGQIVSQYQSLVCSLGYSATGSLSQSEDLAQEIFLKAWRELGKLKEPQKLRSWLCGIARNTIVDALRGQHREPAQHAETLDALMEFPAEDIPIADGVIQREEEAILWRSLEQIPENYREPLILFYREGESVGRVAQELELSEDAVKQRLSRGRKLLAEEVTAFVESTLKRSTPGSAFTVAVLATIPLAAKTASAAIVGVGVLKSATATTVSQSAVNTFIMTTKTKILLAVVLTAAAVGTPMLIQQRTVVRLRDENQLLQHQSKQIQAENQRLSNATAEAASSARLSEEQFRELLRLRGEVGLLQNTKRDLAANAAAGVAGQNLEKGDGENLFSKMLKDPEAKKFMRDQQRLMVAQLYGPLIKQLGLSPEETEKFQEMILDNQMKMVERNPVFNGKSIDPVELGKAMAADQKTFNEQLKEFLGEARYAQYKEYEQTSGERLQLSELKKQSGASAPTDQQIEQLLAIMKKEKQNGAAANSLSGNKENLQAMLSGGQTEKIMESQQTMNERIYQRAVAVLSAEQLEAFGKFQTNQLQMMRAGMSMAQKMFAPGKENGSTRPNQ